MKPAYVRRVELDTLPNTWIEDNIHPTHVMESPLYVRRLTEDELVAIELDADATELEEIE